MFSVDSCQMRRKVARLTQTLYDEGYGDSNKTAQVFCNFVSQLAVKPFMSVSPKSETPQHKFGVNALATLAKAKECCNKPGSPADMFRRNVIAAGATGPLATKQVFKPSQFSLFSLCFMRIQSI